MNDTPIYASVVRDLAGKDARALVRKGLRECPKCGAAALAPCRTATGKVTRDHAGRWAA